MINYAHSVSEDNHTHVRSGCLCAPSSPSWNPNPQGDGIRRWGLWEMIESWMELVHLEETQSNPLPPPAIWGHSEKKATRALEVCLPVPRS